MIKEDKLRGDDQCNACLGREGILKAVRIRGLVLVLCKPCADKITQIFLRRSNAKD